MISELFSSFLLIGIAWILQFFLTLGFVALVFPRGKGSVEELIPAQLYYFYVYYWVTLVPTIPVLNACRLLSKRHSSKFDWLKFTTPPLLLGIAMIIAAEPLVGMPMVGLAWMNIRLLEKYYAWLERKNLPGQLSHGDSDIKNQD